MLAQKWQLLPALPNIFSNFQGNFRQYEAYSVGRAYPELLTVTALTLPVWEVWPHQLRIWLYTSQPFRLYLSS